MEPYKSYEEINPKYAGSYIRDYQNEIKAKLFDQDGRTMLLCKENGLYGF